MESNSNPLFQLTALQRAQLSPGGFAEHASGGQWRFAKHLVYLNNVLMQVATRKIRRLMVSMPPRHGKSELISKYLPAWVAGALRQKVIFTAHSADFASEYGVHARDLIRDYGQEVFNTKINPSMAYASHWETTNGGVMYAVGAGGSITGRGCDWLIIDDPVKNDEEADSSTMRAKIASWFRTTAFTRLEPNGVIIIVMTRWHDEDLIGTLLRNNPDQWRVVRFPAIAEEHDDLGRRPGDVLWPERWTIEDYMEKEAELEPHEWSAMFQQNPTLLGGNKIQSDWWRYYDELPPTLGTVIAWDAATSAKDGTAYSCAAVWSQTATGYYLREVRRERVEFPELVSWAHDFNSRYPGALNLIEDASSGRPLVQVLRAETRYPVIAVPVHNDKVARLNTVMHMIAGGRCYLPRRAPWLKNFLDEHHRFPQTTYKDQVDTTSLVLRHFMDGWLIDTSPKPRDRDAPWYTPQNEYRDLLNFYDIGA